MPLPIPRAAPVTIATLPLSCMLPPTKKCRGSVGQKGKRRQGCWLPTSQESQVIPQRFDSSTRNKIKEGFGLLLHPVAGFECINVLAPQDRWNDDNGVTILEQHHIHNETGRAAITVYEGMNIHHTKM